MSPLRRVYIYRCG